MNYNNLTRLRYAAAVHAGELGPAAQRGVAGSRSVGTWVRFDVVLESSGAVAEAKFQAFGCPHVIAVADWVAERAPGTRAAALPESVEALRERFAVPIEKLGRLLIVEDAWIAALRPPYRD